MKVRTNGNLAIQGWAGWVTETMDNSWFFEKFELIADLPDAIPRMRELVLELAVQGRLSNSKRPESFRQIDVDSKEPTCSDQSGIKHLPEGWNCVTLESVLSEIRNGYNGKANKSTGRYRLTRIETISNGTIDFQRVGFINDCELTASVIEKYQLRFGDILLSHINSEPHLGKTAIYTEDSETLIHGVNLLLLRTVTTVSPFYVNIVLRNLRASGYFKSIAKRAINQASINQKNLRIIPIPLPPLSEQHRIVSKVEELLGICDRLELEQREREELRGRLVSGALKRFSDTPSVENLGYLFHGSYGVSPSDLRKTILTLAVQGKLVPQDPKEGSAEELLKHIAAHKSSLAKSGNNRGPVSINVMAKAESAFDLPESWCWARFGEVMINRDGERIPVSKDERENKAKIFDYYGASGVIDKIDGYLFDKPLLLIGEDGANLVNRSTPIAFIARGKYWVNNHAHVLDGISEDFLKFIEVFINAINLEKYITGSAQPKMNQAKMNSIPVPLPPLSEQRRIVAKVEELMTMVDELEQMELQTRQRSASLLDAIVHRLSASAG